MKNKGNESQWCPFRPDAADLERIGEDVAEIPDIQQKLLANNGDLKFPDRVAHQYQIAGSRVVFQVVNDLPGPLCGVGLFQPGAHGSDCSSCVEVGNGVR